MAKISRKKFIRNVSLGVAGTTLLGACNPNTTETPNVISNEKFLWRMVTTWPPNFPILGEGCQLFADWVETMSQGRLKIKVFGGGELVPPLEVFDAVSKGSVEIGHGASYYWTGKMKAAPAFCAIPFGMNAQQMNAWLYGGGGLELWRELYEPFDVVPYPAGNTGVQMGGWYNKEINSVDDIKGLKMRMPGLGAQVLEKLGGSPILKPGSELYTSLERGVIDATEWIGPYHDYLMGFYKISKYYYSPGWHEIGPTLEQIVNKSALEKLPIDLQTIIEVAAGKLNVWMLSQFEAINSTYLEKIKNESDIEFRSFSKEILAELKIASREVIDNLMETDPMSKKIYGAFFDFYKSIKPWADLSEKEYYCNL